MLQKQPWVRLLLFGVVVCLISLACEDDTRTSFEPYDNHQQEPDTLNHEQPDSLSSDSLSCNEWSVVHDGWITLVSNNPDSCSAMLTEGVWLPSFDDGCWQVELQVELRYDGDVSGELFETVAFMFERQDYGWGTWMWEHVPAQWNPENCPTVDDPVGLNGVVTVDLYGVVWPEDSGRWYQLTAEHGWSTRDSFPCIEPPAGASAQNRNSIEIGLCQMRFCEKE
ncbi:MAG: hypothetical protein KDD55_00310 [Bdellovibrionales bacterium]|nr:hypothetical protein [Bdellovibrionales bacterium]